MMLKYDPIDLHLVSWNRPKMTELVVRTIHRNTKKGSFRLHVFDNGSDQRTRGMLRRLEREGLLDTLNLNPRNVGLEMARHRMLYENTDSQLFVCIDNDCLPPPMLLDGENPVDWLGKMIKLMDDYPAFAAISMRTQVMIGTGNIFEEADEVGDDIVEFPHPGGSFRIMLTEAVKTVGAWAEMKPGRGAEERYIAGKLHQGGWRTAFAVQVQCLHLFGLRGANNATDRWGYTKDLKPEDTGHSDIDHPALRNGDDSSQVALYAGKELAHDYCDN